MWRVDHYLTMDHHSILQVFRKISKQLEDRKNMQELTPGEERFFFDGYDKRVCRVLAFQEFLTAVFPELGPEQEDAAPSEEELREGLHFLAQRARHPVFSAVFFRSGPPRAWLGVFDGVCMADGVWGQKGREPEFSLMAELIRLPDREDALRKAWAARSPEELRLALERALGLPFGLPEDLESSYDKLEDRMAMKLYSPLTPAFRRFSYFPRKDSALPAARAQRGSLLGRCGLHLYRKDLNEERLFRGLGKWSALKSRRATVLVDRDYITIWEHGASPLAPEDMKRLSQKLRCRAVSTLICGQKALALCAAQSGEMIAAACWQSFDEDAWGTEQERREAWREWLWEHAFCSGLEEGAAGRLCAAFGFSPERLAEAVRFGNLSYLLERLPAIMGINFHIPGGIESFPSKGIPGGKVYWKPEKKGLELWK